MKVYPFKIPKPNNNALIYQEDIEVVFYDKLHQHDEIQISYIEKGNGTLLVGNSFTNYYTGNVFVIGSNVPHAFKSDTSKNETSKMLTLFFTKESFGTSFFKLEEFEEIESFFVNSLHGFQVTSQLTEIKEIFNKLKKATKLERFIILIALLKLLSESDINLLSNYTYAKKLSDSEGKRMRKVFDYTLKNADQKISLDEIASVANMTKNAFCKFFKKRTNKTYINYLTELRIENACKILKSNKDMAIVDVAFKAGFYNISNFNRRFKELKKMTPLTFRNL
ncbi:AraC family transcriptional regulator [Polaribacter marinivivus]|uniref:AraC family transcriptional regulator n=1 Tax=Polaribacter marinivivus TaxID=1524260 RepID=A0ABV8RB04_9FLAO